MYDKAAEFELFRLTRALRREKDADVRKGIYQQILEFASKTEPQARKFHNKLVSVGGEHVNFQLYSDGRIRLVNRLLKQGQVWPGRNSVLRRGERSECHKNAARFWAGSGGSLRIATGYALIQKDGVWREHSWNVTPQGNLVESTLARDFYFGVVLSPHDSLDEFLGNVFNRIPKSHDIRKQ